MTSLKHRPDIDGLRAVAILSVVAYHIGIPGAGGGFVGVDVFFVISGFLITALLMTELRERGSIDLLAFYARRARRLLPAFFVVVAVTLLLGFLVLTPLEDEQKDLARSAMAAAVYLANIHFAQTTGGYFDGLTELVPLLHTWSLAVEEQFYVIWPLLLIACAWAASRWRFDPIFAIAAVLAVSFAASLALSWAAVHGGKSAMRTGFFVLTTRAWELAIGAALALALPYVRARRPRFGFALALAGLLAIGVSIALLAHGLKRTVEALSQRGIKTILIAPTPEQRFEAPHCLARKPIEFCSIGRDRAERHRSAALRAMKGAAGPYVRIWDPATVLCGEERCLVERDGVVVYRDNDHVSHAGSLWLARHFGESLAWLAQETRGAGISRRRDAE